MRTINALIRSIFSNHQHYKPISSKMELDSRIAFMEWKSSCHRFQKELE